MVDFVKMITHRKGDQSTYRPAAGTVCLISPPHCDNDDGYVFKEYEVLWCDDLFVVYRAKGCWPVINKWEHLIAKPLQPTVETDVVPHPDADRSSVPHPAENTKTEQVKP